MGVEDGERTVEDELPAVWRGVEGPHLLADAASAEGDLLLGAALLGAPLDAGRAEKMADTMTVANVRYATDGHAVVRVVADGCPMEGAAPVEPTLEDLYLLAFRDAGMR